MSLLRVALSFLLSSCCTYITKQEAIRIAAEEVNRRHFTLPVGYAIQATKATPIAESGPETPLYLVAFNQPDRPPPNTRYEVNVNRCTGKVEAFGDFRKSRLFRVKGAVIEQKRGEKWVPVMQ